MKTCKKHERKNPKGIKVGDIVMGTCESFEMFKHHEFDGAKVLKCSHSTCLIEKACGCQMHISYHWIYPKPVFGKCCHCCPLHGGSQ